MATRLGLAGRDARSHKRRVSTTLPLTSAGYHRAVSLVVQCGG